MQIYIMRHGEAHAYAKSDKARSLTEKGERESFAMATWLSSKLAKDKLDLVLVSPYLRAQQTWQVCKAALPMAKKVITDEGITPYGHSSDIATYLRALISVENPKTVLLVSHLPLVGYLTAEFEKGISAPMFPTSGVACIDYDPESQKSRLLFLENPKTII